MAAETSSGKAMPDTRPTITLVTAMRNEGAFLLEWLAHHKALGVTAAIVVTNDCDDGTDAFLDRLHESGEVLHLRQEAGEKSVQWQALRLAEREPCLSEADWTLAIDCDEFVNLRAPLDTLQDLVAACPAADAIALPWRLFGHGGHLGYSDEPATRRFTSAIFEDAQFPAAARYFKTLARWRDGPFRKLGVHRPRAGPGPLPVWCDGSGRRLPDTFASDDRRILLLTPRIETGLVQLNHYSLRSAEDFLVKRARGLANRKGKALDATYWAERNFNNVEDSSIARHRPATEAEIARLRSLPGVADAHGNCVRRHRDRIAELLSDRKEALLFSRLALLGSSIPPPPDTARRLLALVHAARRN